MSEIRVLIIDDSAAVRCLLADALAGIPGLSVTGSAANGRIGLDLISQVKPDVVVLDLDMPEMDGFQVLASLRATDPTLPVLILSGTSSRVSKAVLEALGLGKIDYITKPSNCDASGSSIRSIADQMSATLKTLGGRGTATKAPTRGSGRPDPAGRPLQVVVIGVSTGGPDALTAVLPQLPADFPAPILIVQHMPSAFIKQLARRLDARSALTVTEAEDGQVVLPGQVVVAPGERHMVASKRGHEVVVTTHQGAPENSCRPAADVLFRSSARSFGSGTLGLVMTGMGQDGLLGAEEIRRAGGQIFAQDEPSSVVWGMPGYVVRAGLANRVLPLDQLAAEVVKRARGESAPGRH